jgi:hypothetical protein
MKAISYWASRHITTTRILLIILGIINFLSGVLMGINFSKTPSLWFINIAGIGIVCSMVFIEKHHRKAQKTTSPNMFYARQNKAFGGLYFCNFLLAILFGQMLLNHTQNLDIQNSEYTTRHSAVEFSNATPSVLVIKKQKKSIK